MPNKTITFGTDLLPLRDKDNANGGFNLGNASLQWNIFGDLTGTASNASVVPLTGVTGADDLRSIEALTGTGLLRRTGNETWDLISISISATDPLTSSGDTGNSDGAFTIKFSNQSPHNILAGPASGNSSAAPAFRTLIPSDLPLICESFTLTGGTATITGTSESKVIQIMVDSSCLKYLHSPITWTLSSNNIQLSATVATNQTITGQIVYLK